MIEIPESQMLAGQLSEALQGRIITAKLNATHAWYAGDPSLDLALLSGHRLMGAEGFGTFVDLRFDDEVHISVGDGLKLRYFSSEVDVLAKYQLLATFDNNDFLVFTVAMYGAIYVYRGELDNPYFAGAVS